MRPRNGATLLRPVERAVKGTKLDISRQAALLDERRDAADLGLAGQKGEDRALLLAQRAYDGARDVVLKAQSGIAPDMSGLDGKGAAFARDHRRVAHEARDARAVERRRHGDKAQILAQAALRVERQRKAEIGVERALVELVEEHGGDASEFRVVEDHAGENALSHDLDARLDGDFGLEPHAQTDRLADVFLQRRGEPLRRGAGGEASWFEQDQPAIAAPGRVEQSQRHARGLARAGRRDEHEIGLLAKRSVQLWQDVVDRQAIGKGANQAGLRECGPLQMRDWRGIWQGGRARNRLLLPHPRRHRSRPCGGVTKPQGGTLTSMGPQPPTQQFRSIDFVLLESCRAGV